MAHSDERALIEEHHLSYGSSSGSGGDATTSAVSGAPDVDVGTAFGSGFDAVWNDGGADEVSDERDGEANGSDGEADDTNDRSEADDGDDAEHEITVALCRWCHAKVHKSWARIDDDVSPDPEAIAAREERRGREFEEAGFESAADRFERE